MNACSLSTAQDGAARERVCHSMGLVSGVRVDMTFPVMSTLNPDLPQGPGVGGGGSISHNASIKWFGKVNSPTNRQRRVIISDSQY